MLVVHIEFVQLVYIDAYHVIVQDVTVVALMSVDTILTHVHVADSVENQTQHGPIIVIQLCPTV